MPRRNHDPVTPDSGSTHLSSSPIPTTEAAPAASVERQRAAFGGMKWGSAFFGWLSATGLAVILLSLATAAGVALGVTAANRGATANQAAANADTIGLTSGIALLVILALAYFAGGYVAGRMARFDGARQGVAVWLVGLLVAIVLAVIGAIAGAQYNVLQQLNLPAIPVDGGTATTAGLIALGVVLLGTLLAAIAGGKTGERYHRKVDRAGAAG